nr:phosphoglycerate mutase-like protein AT74H [Ipomoea batatas]
MRALGRRVVPEVPMGWVFVSEARGDEPLGKKRGRTMVVGVVAIRWLLLRLPPPFCCGGDGGKRRKNHHKLLPKRIILVRHGESQGNKDDAAYTVTPDYKIPLTPHGIEQAHRAGSNIQLVVSDHGASRNWKVAERMKVIKETRERFGRFFYRFPEGFLESLWRDVDMHRFHCQSSDELNLVIVSHGLAIRVFFMKWFKWTVEQFEHLNNLGNCEFRVMQIGRGGEYSLAVHHSDEEMRSWGLTPEMIEDQKWRANAPRGAWNENCSWYLDAFFDSYAVESDDCGAEDEQ